MKDGAKPVGQKRKRSIATIELYNVILCIRVIKYTSINAKRIFRILFVVIFIFRGRITIIITILHG